MIDGLTFDEATHTYRKDGAVVPSVTTILKPLSNFSAVPPAVLEAASQFGTAVHLATELWDLGQLNEDVLDPNLDAPLSAWKAFCADHNTEWQSIEGRVYHAGLRYAGTYDRYGLVDGDMAIVDIKTSAALYPSVGPQLSAYLNALPGCTASTKRYAVQLKRDGSFHLQEYKDPSDWPLFCSLVTLRNWTAKHSITPNF